MDRQSRAFREATDDDHWSEQLTDDDIVHEPLVDVHELRLPEDFEDDDWDSDRDEPKSIEEAQQSLRDRIANPEAPDEDDVEGAYDN